MIVFNPEERLITFKGSYKLNTGPLPTLTYPLIGLWKDSAGEVIKALFKADTVLMHEKEPIFHRYEGVAHQNHAKYRYFIVPGYAGLVLSPKHNNSDVIHVQHYLVKPNSVNLPETVSTAEKVEIPDLLGNFEPIVLYRQEAYTPTQPLN
jgi:hypothetical protein